MADSTFQKLNKINVADHVEKKGKFDYLSWADAVTYLLEACPDATWEVTKVEEEGTLAPYLRTAFGIFVEVSVTVNEITRRQIHPVLNHQNKPIKEPTAFDINTSLARCLTKAIALHGLGLSVYRGEDLPPSDGDAPAKKTQQKSTSSGPRMASEKQLKYLRSLAKKAQIDDPTANRKVTAREASDLIATLQNVEQPDILDGPPAAPEEFAWHDDWEGACDKCGGIIAEGHYSLLHLESGMRACETCGTETCNKLNKRR
jgi:hypothetical protein